MALVFFSFYWGWGDDRSFGGSLRIPYSLPSFLGDFFFRGAGGFSFSAKEQIGYHRILSGLGGVNCFPSFVCFWVVFGLLKGRRRQTQARSLYRSQDPGRTPSVPALLRQTGGKLWPFPVQRAPGSLLYCVTCQRSGTAKSANARSNHARA